MRKFCLLFVFLSLLIGKRGLAQEDLFDLDKTVESIEPTAASIGKYGEYPVSYSTGLPTIVVPLYTIKSGNLTIPIELRYHGGGIKVNEEASWVGLGWDLTYGGGVTRRVYGYPDEDEDLDNVPDVEDIYDYMDENSGSWSDLYLKKLCSSNFYKNDEYYFNLAGSAGMFILRDGDTPVEIPYSNNQIYWTPSSLGGSIILTDGTTYNFGNAETTDVLPNSDDFPSYYSTWHVKSIISANSTDYTYLKITGTIG